MKFEFTERELELLLDNYGLETWDERPEDTAIKGKLRNYLSEMVDVVEAIVK